MQVRNTKILIQKAGGTAGKTSRKYRVGLPSAWVNQLGVTAEDPEVELIFTNHEIVIRKKRRLLPAEFQRRAQKDRHLVKEYRYFNDRSLCTVIYADFTAQELAIENHTDQMIHRAFGVNEHPTWPDFLAFLEERCVPRTRIGIQHILEEMGLTEYDPVRIVEISQGRMAEDAQWLEINEIK